MLELEPTHFSNLTRKSALRYEFVGYVGTWGDAPCSEFSALRLNGRNFRFVAKRRIVAKQSSGLLR